LVALLWSGSSGADVLSIEGTLSSVTGFPIGVEIGDTVRVAIDYDPETPPRTPGFNGFKDAIHSFTMIIPEASISLLGTGQFVNSIILINDSSDVIDSLTFSIDDITGTTMLGGETVTSMNINLQETEFGGPPDLITTETSLPFVPLDFATTGTISMGVGMSLSGDFGNNFIATSFDPIQTVPEPSETLAAVVVLSTLGVVRMRNRGRRVREKPGKRNNPGKAHHAHI
jgi:hypothetical protein